MSIKNWTKNECRILAQMLKDGATVAQIARILNKNYHTVNNVLLYRNFKRVNNEWVKNEQID